MSFLVTVNVIRLDKQTLQSQQAGTVRLRHCDKPVSAGAAGDDDAYRLTAVPVV